MPVLRFGAGKARADAPKTVIYAGAGIAVPATFLAGTFSAPYISFGSVRTTTFTANAGTDLLTIGGNNGRLWRAQYAELTTTGTLPAPLQTGVKYTIVEKGVNADPALWTTFKLSLNGQVIDITNTGSGTHSALMSLDDLGSPVGALRSLDSSHSSWAIMNPANGVYDFSQADDHVLFHFARGRKTLFTFNQTPAWAARNAALDAYGSAGGGQVPTDMNTAATFALAYLGRYNAVSAVNPTGAKMVMGIEIQNEPSHAATGTASQNWCGTTSELAQFARIVFGAIHSTYPEVLRIGPGYTSGASMINGVGDANSLHAFLTAADGAGGFGKDHIDGVAYHQYFLANSTDMAIYASRIDHMRSVMVAAGLASDFPLYQTERGVDSLLDPRAHARCAVVAAAKGVKMDVTYTWDSYKMNPRDYPECRAALELVGQRLPGKTLTYCAIMQDDSVRFIADGVTTTI